VVTKSRGPRLTEAEIAKYEALPYEERCSLDGQIKMHIIMTLTRRAACSVQVYPWEDPFEAAQIYLARQR
jgi:hypothetical protein